MKKKTILFCTAALVAACSFYGCNDDESIAPEKAISVSVIADDMATRADDGTSAAGSLAFFHEDGTEAFALCEEVTPLSAFADDATKGSTVTTANISQFGVDGYLTTAVSGVATHYIENRPADKTTTGWTLLDADSKPYNWVNGTSIAFWARAPYTQPVTVASDYGTMSFNYTLDHQDDNADATRQQDIVAAYANVSYNDTEVSGYGTAGTVNFAFAHALSAIRFDVSDLPDGHTVTKVTLNGINAGGSCVVTPGTNAGDAPAFAWTLGTETGTYVQALESTDFDAATVGTTDRTAVLKENGNKVFFIPPQTFGEGASVVLTINDGTTDTDVTASLEGKTVEVSKMYTYNVVRNSETYEYTLSVSGPANTFLSMGTPEQNYRVTSYKTSSATSTSSAVAWTAEFSLDGGTTWQSELPYWFNTFTASGDGSVSPTQYAAKMRINDDPSSSWGGLAAEIADTKASAYDLSCHDIYGAVTGGTERSVPFNTANSYVVSQPGWYCLPGVYGNAIKNGSDNASAYRKGASATTGVMGAFLNHLGNDITDPWIKNNGITVNGAELLWQDVPQMVKEVSYESDYVYFYIDPEQIGQGNAVIAAKSGDDIVWSWHIWVMDHPSINLATVDVYAHPTTNTSVVNPNQMLKMNLGYSNFSVTARTAMVRITQAESGETATFTIGQQGGMEFTNSPYYQWGRKDPMYPASSTNANTLKTIYDSQGPIALTMEAGPVALARSIREPKVFFTVASGSYNNWSNVRYDNLWNYNQTRVSNNTFTDVVVGKTIYDPCPPGFKVPNGHAFTGFTTTGDAGTASASNSTSMASDKGYYFYTNLQNQSAGTVFFPALGNLHTNSGIQVQATEIGGYWTAAPYINNVGGGSGTATGEHGVRLQFANTGVMPFTSSNRAFAYPVRPVVEDVVAPPFEIDESPVGVIVAWQPTETIRVTDPELMPVIAYLAKGSDFNAAVVSAAGGAGNVSSIVFDRFGAVDEDGVRVDDVSRGGAPIYASFNAGVVTITTSANTIYANADCKGLFKNFSAMTTLNFGQFFQTVETTNMSEMFMGCAALTSLDLTDVFSTQGVTDMSHMFDGMTSASNIYLGSRFNTSSVEDMSYMFNMCQNCATVNLGQSFYTSRVTNMEKMFYECRQFSNFDLGTHFDTSSVTNMNSMFGYCIMSQLHLNSLFNFNSVTSAAGMFEEAFQSSAPHVIYCKSAAQSWILSHSETQLGTVSWSIL